MVSYVSTGAFASFSNVNAVARTCVQSTFLLLRALLCMMSRASERYCCGSKSGVGEGVMVDAGACVGVRAGVTGTQAVMNNANKMVRIPCGNFFMVDSFIAKSFGSMD